MEVKAQGREKTSFKVNVYVIRFHYYKNNVVFYKKPSKEGLMTLPSSLCTQV